MSHLQHRETQLARLSVEKSAQEESSLQLPTHFGLDSHTALLKQCRTLPRQDYPYPFAQHTKLIYRLVYGAIVLPTLLYSSEA